MTHILTLGNRQFAIEKISLSTIDEFKKTLGVDLLSDDPEAARKIATVDCKTMAKAIAVITTEITPEPTSAPVKHKKGKMELVEPAESPESLSDARRLEERAEYIYKNAELSDFKKTMDFFSEYLKSGFQK